jgi:hypothetical protein
VSKKAKTPAENGPDDAFPVLDRSRLQIGSLADREHLLTVADIRSLKPADPVQPALAHIGRRLREARCEKAARVLMLGAHVIRSGVQRYIIDMMERGCISCLALNGAGVIHDFEFARIGATTESVETYISDGRFGMWWELERLNTVVADAAAAGQGIGEAVGREIGTGEYPYRDISLLAAAHRLGIPATVHVGIGYDIVHQLPNCDGGSYGAASYTDFLRFAQVLTGLSNGVLMCFGSAVMGPEVYLKALSMARNLARQAGATIADFDTLVCDLAELPASLQIAPDMQAAHYYFRPWKTILFRTVAGKGQGYYVRGLHAETVPQLWTATRLRQDRPATENQKGSA